MIVYSVSVTVEPIIHEEWLAYMKHKHIAEVIATGCFNDYKMYKILSTQEADELSYNIQYFCNSMDDFYRYQNSFAKELQKEHHEKFGQKALAFRTLLESIV